jgi:hypothetical protein
MRRRGRAEARPRLVDGRLIVLMRRPVPVQA